MPGKQVKNWRQYEALRREGKSKESAARITNSQTKKRSTRARNPKGNRSRRTPAR